MFFKSKQKETRVEFTRTQKSVLVLFFAVFIFIFFSTHSVKAVEPAGQQPGFFTGVLTGPIMDYMVPKVETFAAETVFVPILKAMLEIDGMILSAAQTIFEWIIVPDNMTAVMNNTAVYNMWRFVRDFFNTSLIMILLFSAFATIFQASTGYHYKKVLLNLVIMALLVNFSYPISRFIIDMSNVFMYGFLNQLSGAGSFWNIIKESGVKDIITGGGGANPSISYLIAAVIFTFMFAVTMVAIAILLVIRTIALTIFIIFSPIAFLGSTQPGTDLANAASGWWKEFMKYCFAGPIMIFMLVLANQMIIAVSSAREGLEKIAKLQTTDAALSGLIASISFFSLPLVVLWLGIERAQSSGIAGAGMVVGAGTKFSKWVGKTLTVRPAKALAHKAERGLAKGKYTWMLSPTAFKAAWKENQAELDRKAFKGSTGGWRDKLNYVTSLGKEKTKFRDAANQGNVATKEKELEATSTNSEYLMKEFESAEKAKDKEKLAAILRILFKDNDQNEFMKILGKEVNPFKMREEIYSRLMASGMNEQEALKHMSDLGEIANSKGNYANYGMAYFNPKTGLYKKASDTEQADAAATKASNIKAQTKADLWHWNSLITQNADGTSGHLHEVGKAILGKLSAADLAQMTRLRSDFLERIGENTAIVNEIIAHANTLTDQVEKDMILEFARRAKGFAADPNFKPENKPGATNTTNTATNTATTTPQTPPPNPNTNRPTANKPYQPNKSNVYKNRQK
jgi:hypothetical protein